MEHRFIHCTKNLQENRHRDTASCILCGKKIEFMNAWADLNGPAFRAYYCPDCKLAECGTTEDSEE